MERCGWVSQDQLYIDYHDREWGVPETDGKKLFEMICLEGQQAGLSWITVLKKRENYRNAFHQFDPVAVAAMTDEDVERLVQDAGIIRHRGKIQAIIGNARAYLAMEQNGESFSDFVWTFVNNDPLVTQAATLAEIPASTPASDALSKALKKRGFKFVGALFVAPSCIGKGIGRALLNHVQQRFPHLTLEVYQKNVRAVNFYHAQGFRIEDSAWQDDTQHPTWIMSWQADQTPLR